MEFMKQSIQINKNNHYGKNVIIILLIFSTLLQTIPLETPNLHHFGSLSILTIVFISCNYYLMTISNKTNEKKKVIMFYIKRKLSTSICTKKKNKHCNISIWNTNFWIFHFKNSKYIFSRLSPQ